MSLEPVRQVFRSMPAPRPVVCDLVKHPPQMDEESGLWSPDFWTIRLYRDNLREMSGEDQVVIANWVFSVIKACRQVHDNISHEVWEKAPV